MRVLMFAWEYPPHMVGGLGKHVAELLPQLVQQDVEVHLLTPRLKGGPAEEELAPNGSRIYRVETSMGSGDFHDNVAFSNIALGAAASDVINRVGDFDLIHAHDWLVSFAAVGLKQHRRLPLLSTIHATELGRSGGHLWNEAQHSINNAEWRLAYESWRIIAASEYMAWEIHEFFDVPPAKIDVIPNGVDTTPFDKLQGVDLSAFRANWANPDEKIVFYVGRLVWEKGLQVLVDAAPEIIAADPNVKFIIAGTGDQRYQLAASARQRGLDNWFIFPGRISDDDRDRMYKVADCAVFPSLYEPFGIVALEAMAAECPVVVSDVGGLAEVVSLHETGLKVHPGDPHSLAWGILHTLQNPQWAKARVATAYRVARELYNWKGIAEMTAATYARVIEEAQANDWAYNGRRKGLGASAPRNGRVHDVPDPTTIKTRMEH